MMQFDPFLVRNIFKEISNVGGYTARRVRGASLKVLVVIAFAHLA
jgi:hypothetical protein